MSPGSSTEDTIFDSGCPAPVAPNGDQGWLGREPTVDEQEIVAWLRKRALPASICHVGVGTALLSREFGHRVTLGITKDGAEAANARELGLKVVVCNKYDVASYEEFLRPGFDCIVDVNVRSYACCDTHFRAYMQKMNESLKPGGMLLTSTRGLDYLIPTSLDSLRRLCPEWSVRTRGTLVIMRPSRLVRLGQWWRSRAMVANAR